MDRIRAASTRDDDLAPRRPQMFAALGFDELVRLPPGREAPLRAQ
jgi:hypothetical protein